VNKKAMHLMEGNKQLEFEVIQQKTKVNVVENALEM
jgi:hypothetical protein